MSAKPSVLIVDDQRSFTGLLTLNIEQTGAFEVRVQNDPRLVVKTLEEFPADFVLLDMMMPDMSGLEVAQQLRSHPAYTNLPIGFLSAALEEQNIDPEDAASRRIYYLGKPASFAAIIQFIQDSLQASRQRE